MTHFHAYHRLQETNKKLCRARILFLSLACKFCWILIGKLSTSQINNNISCLKIPIGLQRINRNCDASQLIRDFHSHTPLECVITMRTNRTKIDTKITIFFSLSIGLKWKCLHLYSNSSMWSPINRRFFYVFFFYFIIQKTKLILFVWSNFCFRWLMKWIFGMF